MVDAMLLLSATVYSECCTSRDPQTVDKLKQRSVLAEMKQLPMYTAGGRCGPHPLQTTCTEDSERQPNHMAELAFCKNMIWMLARRVDPVSQVIPSWKRIQHQHAQ